MAKSVSSTSKKKPAMRSQFASKKAQASSEKRQQPLSAKAKKARSQLTAPEERERMIQYAAYHIAEKDGFKAGKETEYWLQAEQQISDLLHGQPTPSSDIH